jgi:hypothetical protein
MSENAGWLEHGAAAGSRPPEANPINAADKERIARQCGEVVRVAAQSSSLPGLTRQSMQLSSFDELTASPTTPHLNMDARVKPAHDE